MRFNTHTKNTNKTTNYEGAVAYKLSPQLELYSAVCTAILQNKFYESADANIQRMRELIKQCNPLYVAKLAVYAREKMYLRSIPIVLAVELAKIHKGDSLISKTVTRIIQRADEITEALAYYAAANERKDTKKLNKLSKQVRKGVASAFYKFNAYAMQKYNRDSAVKLRDALFLTHPKPLNKEQEVLFKQIADDTLPTPYTWEVELSKAGTDGKDKKLVWEQLIDSDKMGYMATIRNCRNFLDAKVSKKHIEKVAAAISNADAVRNSKQLPFRFLSAYRELEDNDNPNTSTILDALESAVITSAENIAGYDANTNVLIACDVSGSMGHTLNPKSSVQYYDIGIMLAMLLHHRCKSVISGIFGDKFKIKQMPKRAILQNVREMHAVDNEVGWSTNGYKVLQHLLDNKIEVDKIMIFTDCQLWDSETRNWRWSSGTPISEEHMPALWAKYKKLYPKAKMYLFDMAGYGHTPLQITNDVAFIAGFSDKIFQVLEDIENGKKAISQIEEINI